METADWSDLVDELDRWADGGRVATFWWRDDDAVAPTPELERLLEAAAHLPISLAVIPGFACLELADRLMKSPRVVVLQHGWRHINHAAPFANSEYPGERRVDEVSSEFAAGRKRLVSLFGECALPVFAPPFHGFDDRFLPLLSVNGITAISRKGPRSARVSAGISQVNVHVVLIEWTDPPSFNGKPAALATLIDHLRARRLGIVDGDEPTGILTHHLVQDSRSYCFIRELADTIVSHPAAKWLDGGEIFSSASVDSLGRTTAALSALSRANDNAPTSTRR